MPPAAQSTAPVAATADDAVPRLDGLSAFVPVHDERDDVVPLTLALLDVLPRVADRWEIILVDDGSRDGSAALIDELARRHAHVRVVRHASNRGYGAAVRSGLAAARHGWVFLIDGDRQFDPAQLPRLVREADAADVVVGYRARRADPLGRRLAGETWTRLVGLLVGVRVRDVNCAFKLFRRRVIAGVPFVATGAAISAELLAHAQRRGARIAEVAVDHFPRRHGRPSGGAIAVVTHAGPELLRVRSRLSAAR
jgi:glycosyltransferase involved in cell wall biosynthesis